MSKWHGGKGSDVRPLSIPREIYNLKHDLIFEKDEKKREQIKQQIKELEALK